MLVLYATSPVKKIVGFAKVRTVVVLSPSGAWRRYRKHGAIDRCSFSAYYAGSKKAVCLEIGEARRLDRPIDPHQIAENFRAPQSFRYLPCRGTGPGHVFETAGSDPSIKPGKTALRLANSEKF